MIDKATELRIKAAAKIEDILEDQGVTLTRSGKDLVGLCPFHDDRTKGSFVVSPQKNMCSCYACGAVGLNPIDTLIRLRFQNLSEKEQYPAALRYIASLYNIPVDDQPAPEVDHKMPLTPPPPKLDRIMWTMDIVKPFLPYNDKNPLLKYMRSLPLTEGDRKRLEKAIQNYLVVTYPGGYHEGWTIWWIVDQFGNVRSGKMMKYKPDGHRDKATNSTWVHTLMARYFTDKNGVEHERERWKYDNHTNQPDLQCLFGQHLMEFFPNAIIRIVESEKTAVLCSAFTDMQQVIWMASGGLQMMSDEKLLTLLKKGRYVELFPDYDGYDEWARKINKSQALRPYIDGKRLVISPMVRELHQEADGPKADIADIMIRIVTTPAKSDDEKTYEMAMARLGTGENEQLKSLITNLKLRID